MQRRLNYNEKGALLLRKGLLLCLLKLHIRTHTARNALCHNDIMLHAQNSRISGLRLLCAFNSQFWAVRNANIVLQSDSSRPHLDLSYAVQILGNLYCIEGSTLANLVA